VRFIAEHKARWGVEPICRELQVAPSSYYAATTRPPSARRRRDEALEEAIRRVWDEHHRVYGADKVWAQLKREEIPVARCTVERLMRQLGLRGVARGKTSVRTTFGDEVADRPLDLVARQFRAPAPNRRWVADLTYVKTHSGWGASWSAGRRRGRSGPTWRSTPWRWRSGRAARRSSPA
jgi:putative transposase